MSDLFARNFFEFALLITGDKESGLMYSTLLADALKPSCIVVRNSLQSAIEFLSLGQKLGREPDLILLDFDSMEKECNDFWQWYFFAGITKEKNVLVIFEGHFEIKHIVPPHYRYLQKPLSLAALQEIEWNKQGPNYS